MDMLADQALTRIGMNGILVLAMVPAIESGVKMNFALPLGIVCGLLGGALSLEFGLMRNRISDRYSDCSSTGNSGWISVWKSAEPH